MQFRYCSLRATSITTFSFQLCTEMHNCTNEGFISFFSCFPFFSVQNLADFFSLCFQSLLDGKTSPHCFVFSSSLMPEGLSCTSSPQKFTMRKPPRRILKLQIRIKDKDLEQFTKKYFFSIENTIFPRSAGLLAQISVPPLCTYTLSSKASA